MSNQEKIERLTELAKACNEIELNCSAVSKKFVLNGSVHRTTSSLRHLEHARMYAGDLLRLAVLLKDHRQTGFFDVAAHGGRYTGELRDFPDAKAFIQWAKATLRDLFYYSIDQWAGAGIFDPPKGVKPNEYMNYGSCFLQHLKEADQCLGLWLGEIYEREKQAPPPSNAKDLPLRTALPTIEEFEESYRGPDRHGRGNYPVQRPRPCEQTQIIRLHNEALFTAIMDDLAPGLIVEVGGQPMAVYPAYDVRGAIRKHLGLPLQSSNTSIPKS